MSNNTPYTIKEMQNRYIACSLLLDPPALDAVTYASGENEGLPVLYNSIDEAKEDMFWDDSWDKVIPANEYYDRIKAGNFKF